MGLFVNINDGEQTHNVQLSSKLYIIGRSSRCDLTIKDELISGQHVGLLVSNDGKATVKDLESTNGTLINTIKIQESYLYIGDEVEIGNVIITLDEEKMRKGERALHTKDSSNQTQMKFIDLDGQNSKKRGLKAMKQQRYQAKEKPNKKEGEEENPAHGPDAVREFRQYGENFNSEEESPKEQEPVKKEKKERKKNPRKNLQKKVEGLKKNHDPYNERAGDENQQQFDAEKTTGFTNMIKVGKPEHQEKKKQAAKKARKEPEEEESLLSKVLNFISGFFS